MQALLQYGPTGNSAAKQAPVYMAITLMTLRRLNSCQNWDSLFVDWVISFYIRSTICFYLPYNHHRLYVRFVHRGPCSGHLL